MTEQELRSFIAQCRLAGNIKVDSCDAGQIWTHAGTLNGLLQLAADKLEKTLPSADDQFLNQISAAYNGRCTSMAICSKLTPKRMSNLRARIKEDKARRDIEWWRAYFVTAADSDFLNGRSNVSWRAGFDWLINKSNMVKVLEGNYQNRVAPARGQREQDSFLDSVSAEHARRTGVK